MAMHEEAHGMAAAQQFPDKVFAYETRSSGNENIHGSSFLVATGSVMLLNHQQQRHQQRKTVDIREEQVSRAEECEKKERHGKVRIPQGARTLDDTEGRHEHGPGTEG
ncbi:MAG: hypothetical protein PHH28_13415, partial [Desulfuromonadaceae bacterium]|nr:hypothetical protein [Desulfuromonadaceae bacterium]